jgi:transcription initiation factor TFIIIB Brf1 subunit/transcription initiation factor TFIIB
MFYTAKEKHTAFALAGLARLGSALGMVMPEIRDAQRLYRKAGELGGLRARRTETVLAALLYECSHGLAMGQIAGACCVQIREAFRLHRRLAHELGLPAKRISAADYLPRFAQTIGASEAQLTEAFRIIGRGRSQASAAAALYLSTGVPQRLLAEKLGVSEPSIRAAAKDFNRQSE